MEDDSVLHEGCGCCRDGAAAYHACSKAMMEKYGFVIHALTDDPSYYRTNVHTHGLAENHGHPDFQILINLSVNRAHRLLCDLAFRVKNGEVFKAGDRVPKVVKNYAVLLIDREEEGRRVLRVILPDRAGNLEEDKIDCALVMQFFGK